MICFNSNLISILNYTNPYLASQVSARGIPKKDISMFHVKKDISVLLAMVSFSGGFRSVTGNGAKDIIKQKIYIPWTFILP